MTKVQCPNCKNTFSIEGRVDDDFGATVKCEACKFTCSAFTFLHEQSTDRVETENN